MYSNVLNFIWCQEWGVFYILLEDWSGFIQTPIIEKLTNEYISVYYGKPRETYT